MRLADTIGGWVGAVADPQAQAVLARHATHHAFHAELWVGVDRGIVRDDDVVQHRHDTVPELGVERVVRGVTREHCLRLRIRDRDDVAAGLRAAFADALPALVAVYQQWAAGTSVVADRPVMRVLDLVLRDEEFDLHEGQAMARALGF